MPDSSGTGETSGRVACGICHKRKVKCDLAAGHHPCTNCRVGNYTCRPHQRKRKRYSSSPSSSTDVRGSQIHEVNHGNSDLASFLNSETTVEQGYQSPGFPATNTALGASTTGIRLVESMQESRPPSRFHRSLNDPPSTERSYVGRSDYLAAQVPFDEEMAVDSRVATPRPENVDSTAQFLMSQRAFDIPPRPIRAGLVDAFMKRCHPWMPIVEKGWLENRGQNRPSILLLQSVFLAGSRVSSGPMTHATSQEYYDRARSLFFHGQESNAMLSIVATCLLQWWNPTGPERISTSTSGFWIRIAVGLAYQIGLHLEPVEGPLRKFRRRLWWTLVCRDSIISVGVGRPRSISLEDSNVAPISTEDFPVADFGAQLFVAYASICKQMGDIAEAQRRHSLTISSLRIFENALLRWIGELPHSLQLFEANTDRLAEYNFEARQLAVPYLTSLLILYRISNAHAPASPICLMASSFVIGIIEDFTSRDELRYLGPAFTFYALAAGLSLLAAYNHQTTRSIVEQELHVVQVALEELGKRWGSAHGALRALVKAKEAMAQKPWATEELQLLPSNAKGFFKTFGPDLCRFWHLYPVSSTSYTGGRNDAVSAADHAQIPRLGSPAALGRSGTPSQSFPVRPQSTQFTQSPRLQDLADIYDCTDQDMQAFDNFSAPIGSWLFQDLEWNDM